MTIKMNNINPNIWPFIMAVLVPGFNPDSHHFFRAFIRGLKDVFLV